MNTPCSLTRNVLSVSLFLAAVQVARPQEVLWTVGMDDNGWPINPGGAGGPDASFVQENGTTNPLPGSPFSVSENLQADNDYYLAGSYYFTIESNGVYDPVGLVDFNEEAAERAFTPGDTEFRYHFNLPANLRPTDLLAVTFDANNFETDAMADPRRGVAVYFNGVLVQPQIVLRPADLDREFTTPAFTLESVNAVAGPDYDNIVTLRGTDYSADGGGRWMGIDYVMLTKESTALPTPIFPWTVGKEDDAWTVGNGGGENASFVEGNGTVNPLPGSPTSTEVAGGADNDYYFAGVYTNVLAGNGTYTAVGTVSANEEAAERGFAGAENELRYHFNLPNTLQPSQLAAVTFDALSLDTAAADPRYGVEVYFNGVLVQSEILIRPAQLDQVITTAPFTLGSVNAQFGLGTDNIITLRGISYSTAGGGASLGLDLVGLKPMPPLPVVPWSVGRNDNAWPVGDGGGASATFVQENGTINPLPGVPNSPETNQQADNDYYFAGIYSSVIAANGTYQPVGDVPNNEEAAERAFAAADNDLRYHFNLPSTLSPDTRFTFSFDPYNLDDSAVEPRYGASVYVNNVLVQDEVLVTPDKLNRTIFTPPFTLAQVNAQTGPGPDNIISLRGTNYSAEGGGNWMGVDYVRLDPVLPPPWPIDVSMDDNTHGGSTGGGANAIFVQEAGTNPLPGNPAGPEVNQLSDDDYYLAGEYTKVIPEVVAFYGVEYEPVGTVLVNEYAAERAFAGSDNEKRYHFNLPASLQPTDQLVVSFDAVDLDTGGTDPQYGVEVYFNGTLIKEEVIIRTPDLDFDQVTEPFTLASVNAEVGPGWDNIVTLRGINHSAEGGGNWMGIDYVNVDPMPSTPVFPWSVGKDDNGWPVGNGGGENATFVQEAGTNPVPGNPKNRELNQQADDDYYFAGVYSTALPANEIALGPYTPAGIVPRNEEAAERAFAGTDNDLRYHFNLPTTLNLTDQVQITFDAFNLDEGETATDPRYGIEVYFNSVLVQPEIVIRPAQLDVAQTTPPFTLASVDARLGPGADNIISLRGVNYNADGGGNWMGIDYVRLHAPGAAEPPRFTSSTVSNGRITLTWTGSGNLESAPAVNGPWSPVTPTPTSPYAEDVVTTQSGRFYRLRQP